MEDDKEEGGTRGGSSGNSTLVGGNPLAEVLSSARHDVLDFQQQLAGELSRCVFALKARTAVLSFLARVGGCIRRACRECAPGRQTH